MEKNYCIFRVEKIKSNTAGTRRNQHNARTRGAALSDRKGEPIMKHITMAETSLKENKRTGKTFAEFTKEKVGEQKIRKNACFGFEIILTYSHGALKPEQVQDWMKESMQFVADVFGKHNLFSAQIHLSETTPHIHIITTCIDEKGKLNAHGIINGPAHLRNLQTEYAKRMERFGLQRGIDKKQTKAKHERSDRWKAKQAEKEVELEAYKKVFGESPEWDFDTFKTFQTAKEDLSSENQQRTEKAYEITNDVEHETDIQN